MLRRHPTSHIDHERKRRAFRAAIHPHVAAKVQGIIAQLSQPRPLLDKYRPLQQLAHMSLAKTDAEIALLYAYILHEAKLGDGLSDSSELAMLQLQSLMSQRSNLISMVSNLLKSQSDTTRSIICNIKG